MKTPMKMWIGKPVDYSSLDIFRCSAYMMYNDQKKKKKKLNPKSKKCILLGYANRVKGYFLWDLIAHKAIISKDVIFVEDMPQSE